MLLQGQLSGGLTSDPGLQTRMALSTVDIVQQHGETRVRRHAFYSSSHQEGLFRRPPLAMSVRKLFPG
jgi:hypothetical protein